MGINLLFKLKNIFTFVLLVFILSSCSEQTKHTVYKLTINKTELKLKNEINSFIELLFLIDVPTITQKDEEIIIEFETLLTEQSKKTFDTIFSNSVFTNAAIDELRLKVLKSEGSTDSVNSSIDMFEVYMNIPGARKEYSLTQNGEIKFVSEFNKNDYGDTTLSCSLKVTLREKIVPLRMALTTIKKTKDNELLRRLLQRQGRIFKVDYSVSLKSKPSKLLSNYEIDSPNYDLSSTLKEVYTFLYYDVARVENSTDCGNAIIATLSKAEQNILVTPMLSKVLISYNRKDIF